MRIDNRRKIKEKQNIINFNLTLLNPKYDNVRDILETYLTERVNEIKDRWK